MPTDVFEALEEEYAALEAMLGSLDDEAWSSPSLCPGWSVADVVLHLAQTEESVGVTTGDGTPTSDLMERASRRSAGNIDEVVEEWVRSERSQSPQDRLERWMKASRACVEALRGADPGRVFPWATIPLKPRTLATTRLSEHWIHANDIAQPLGIDYPDTPRLWHVARLAHRTIPYAYSLAGRDDPPAVRVEITSPEGETWEFGPEDAGCSIRGDASEFCRIAARRLDPADAPSVVGSGDRAAEVLALIRTYA